MPELPEVETIARRLDQCATGDVIESVWLGKKPEPLKSTALEIARVLEGSRIARVRRVGKHIVFDLEQSPVARAPWSAKNRKPRPARPGSKTRPAQASAITPGVADKACLLDEGGVRSTPAGATQSKSQWIVHLGMTGRLQVCKPQDEILKHTHAILQLASGRELRFVDPRRFGRLSVTQGFQAPGTEPLQVELERFVQLFKGRKTPIKSALLNQRLLSGVGNIYADESLFRAGIRPRRRA